MIVEKRAELVTILYAVPGLEGMAIYDHVPEQVAPPCVAIQPGERFVDLDPDATYGDPFLIAFDVFVLVPLDDHHDNEQASHALDQALDSILDTVQQSRWHVESMAQPGPLFTTGWVEHGQRITVRTTAGF